VASLHRRPGPCPPHSRRAPIGGLGGGRLVCRLGGLAAALQVRRGRPGCRADRPTGSLDPLGCAVGLPYPVAMFNADEPGLRWQVKWEPSSMAVSVGSSIVLAPALGAPGRARRGRAGGGRGPRLDRAGPGVTSSPSRWSRRAPCACARSDALALSGAVSFGRATERWGVDARDASARSAGTSRRRQPTTPGDDLMATTTHPAEDVAADQWGSGS
jgi:hypothetical protein